MASVSSSESMPQMSASEAKLVLNEVIRAMNETSNCAKMSSAGRPTDSCHEECHRLRPQMSAVRHMQFVFPIATQILMDVISNYGFSKSGEGVIQFTLAVRRMERYDEEIKRLNTQLKTYFLPNLDTSLTAKSTPI